MYVVSMFSVILGFFKINPVNGLAFVCLSFHVIMLGSSYVFVFPFAAVREFGLYKLHYYTNSVIINLQKVRLSLSY